MSEDLDQLPARERARAGGRDRKIRGPKVVMDNPGLRKAALERARKLREADAGKPPAKGQATAVKRSRDR